MDARTGNGFARLRLRIDPARVRGLVETVNDGILAVSGFSQGLSGGDAVRNLASPIVLLAAVAGALSVASIALASTLADRDAEQVAAAEERRLLELSPQQQVDELAAYYEQKGVSPATARQVAAELNAVDPIAAQLEVEGFDEPITIGDAVTSAVLAALAFLLGAAVPVLISVVTPGEWRDEYTAAAVVVALALTSVLLARLGHTRIWQTLLRSVAIGLAALGGSYLIGSVLL
ncbi:MAG: VIT1/CCC1 transporter family protein [Propionibacteriaceae bacterium]|nr:VIT1/CCC1 transporter family protein [Propionibacteriaceae bacterium]